MYTFFLNIGGWTQYYPKFEGAGLDRRRNENQIFSRDYFDGQLIFEDDEYEQFSLTDVNALIQLTNPVN